ncbi:unnamed protein product [Closterium sp. NIES-65]|nr:unnamed protein product [Closterium sp. NIES-65]
MQVLASCPAFAHLLRDISASLAPHLLVRACEGGAWQEGARRARHLALKPLVDFWKEFEVPIKSSSTGPVAVERLGGAAVAGLIVFRIPCLPLSHLRPPSRAESTGGFLALVRPAIARATAVAGFAAPASAVGEDGAWGKIGEKGAGRGKGRRGAGRAGVGVVGAGAVGGRGAGRGIDGSPANSVVPAPTAGATSVAGITQGVSFASALTAMVASATAASGGEEGLTAVAVGRAVVPTMFEGLLSLFNPQHHRNGIHLRTRDPLVAPISAHAVQSSCLRDIFAEQLRSEVRSAGDKPSATVQPFSLLQLDIALDRIRSVEEALKAFVVQEVVEGYRPSNAKPNQTVLASKTVKISALPHMLVLHLMRFSFSHSTTGSVKIHKPVSFLPPHGRSPTTSQPDGSCIQDDENLCAPPRAGAAPHAILLQPLHR